MTGSWNTNQYKITDREVTFISAVTGATHTYALGDLVDNTYRLIRFLGQGGMGVVFACQHVGLGKEYAIKIVTDEKLSEEAWTRFQAEARALAKLNHPGIVGVHNMFVDDGRFPYYVMDLLQGQSLDALIKSSGPLDPDKVLDIFVLVVDALDAAHQQGIIHRDVKPSNIMLLSDKSEPGSVKIVDFGIARLSAQNFANQSQTKTGQVFGTPFYMSPEQCQGARVDLRSDIYSLGCALFEALAGEPPFHGENAFQTFMLHQSMPPPLLSQVGVGRKFAEGFDQLVGRMLAKNPDARYQNMAQVKQDMERLRAGKVIRGLGRSSADYGAVGDTDEQNLPLSMRNSRIRKPGGALADSVGGDDDIKPWYAAKLVMVACLGLAAIGLVLFGLNTNSKLNAKSAAEAIAAAAPPAVPVNMLSINVDPNLDKLSNFDFERFHKDKEILFQMVAKYFKDPGNRKKSFRYAEGFKFPDDFYLCALSVDRGIPFLASGFVSVQQSERICLYLFESTSNHPDVLDKFSADDLCGLEILTQHPEVVLKKIRNWHKLDELSFYNDLIKRPGKAAATYDESVISDKTLPYIDKFTTLKSLGICGPAIHGGEIVKMDLLKTLNTLKVKNIEDFPTLLAQLPARDNLKEVWIDDEQTTDQQLESLTHMKNLQKLNIRNSRLTPKSLDYFKRMHSLKSLHLDRDWQPEQKLQFKHELPAYEDESSVDTTYWQMFPDKDKNARLDRDNEELTIEGKSVNTEK